MDWVSALTGAVVALFVYDVCARVFERVDGAAEWAEAGLFAAALFLLGTNFFDFHPARRVAGMAALVFVALVLRARDRWARPARQ